MLNSLKKGDTKKVSIRTCVGGGGGGHYYLHVMEYDNKYCRRGVEILFYTVHLREVEPVPYKYPRIKK